MGNIDHQELHLYEESYSLYWGGRAVIGIQKPYYEETMSPYMIVNPKLETVLNSYDNTFEMQYMVNNKSNESFVIDAAIGIVNPNDNSIQSIHTIQNNVLINPLILYPGNSFWYSVFLKIPIEELFQENGIYKIIPLYRESGFMGWVTGFGDMPNYYNVKYNNGIVESLWGSLGQANLEVTNVAYAGNDGNRLFYDVTFKNHGESLWCHLRYNLLDVNETLQSFTNEPNWHSLTELNIKSGDTETVRFIFDYDGSISGDYYFTIVLCGDIVNHIGDNNTGRYSFPVIYQGLITLKLTNLTMSSGSFDWSTMTIPITVTNNGDEPYERQVAVRIIEREFDYKDKDAGALFKSEKLHIEPGESMKVVIPCSGLDIDKLYLVGQLFCKNSNSDVLTNVENVSYLKLKSNTISRFKVDGIQYRVVDTNHHYVFAYRCTDDVEEDLVIPSTVISPTDGITYTVKGIDNNFCQYKDVGTVTISEGITTIESYSFYRCENLTTLILPVSINRIGASMIVGCPNLTSIYMKKTEAPLIVDYNGTSKSLIGETNQYSKVTLYVPIGSKEKYAKAWPLFTNIVEKELPKCATPSISLVGGKLHFECATEGVQYHYVFTLPESEKGTGNDVTVTATTTYVVKVYASKAGYADSEIATANINVAGLKGDVNDDGVVDIADAVKIVNFVVGKVDALSREQKVKD